MDWNRSLWGEKYLSFVFANSITLHVSVYVNSHGHMWEAIPLSPYYVFMEEGERRDIATPSLHANDTVNGIYGGGMLWKGLVFLEGKFFWIMCCCILPCHRKDLLPLPLHSACIVRDLPR